MIAASRRPNVEALYLAGEVVFRLTANREGKPPLTEWEQTMLREANALLRRSRFRVVEEGEEEVK